MKGSDEVAKYWEEFCRIRGVDPSSPYQVWFFGLDADQARELAALVLEGKKTATASQPWEYDDNPDDYPTVGTHSVVTDYDGNPLCVVRTTEVRVVPFNEVDAEFAFDEGEGDQSLDYWRSAHWDYFMERCARAGREATETMPVICERFELLYPKGD